MIRELSPDKIIYNIDLEDIKAQEEPIKEIDYSEILKKVKRAMEIKDDGFNLYIADEFSEVKIKKIQDFLKDVVKDREAPGDICLVNLKDIKTPEVLYLRNSMGNRLKSALEKLKDLFFENVYRFYNNSGCEEKEQAYDAYEKKKSIIINEIMKAAEDQAFEVKHSKFGFIIMPLKDGSAISEKEFDELNILEKEKMIDKASKIRRDAEEYMNALKNLEEVTLEDIKSIFKSYLEQQLKEERNNLINSFSDDPQAFDYLNSIYSIIFQEIVDLYTGAFDEDELKINEAIYRYQVNVLLDNDGILAPPIIFLQDPSIDNLIGSIDYENQKGSYVTDLTLIKAGSIIKANEGCLILRLRDILSHGGSYYYLKKMLLKKSVSFDYNKGYLELLSLGGLRIKEININLKVIILGDYESFTLLYNYEEDFKNLFKLKAIHYPEKDISPDIIRSISREINYYIKDKGFLDIIDEGLIEVFRELSRKADSRNKLYYDLSYIQKILILANKNARDEGRVHLGKEEIASVIYEDDALQEEIYSLYKNKKVILDLSDKRIGAVNGLSVVDVGFISFGKPLRITCICSKGEGAIIDAQREGSLSGKIHEKSTSILKGYINNILLESYEKLPVDFYLSFEQVYGKVDGDSASVAEAVAMISALSKIPIKQNLAVTGSLNQFGEVQAVGGIKEKIEGFFNVCQLMDNIKDKGVIIPYSNLSELVLRYEVEEAIAKGDFKIYAVNTLEEVIDILMTGDRLRVEDVFQIIQKEIKKYSERKR